MATSRRAENGDEEEEIASVSKGAASRQDRIAAFVMLDGMKDKTQAEKSVRLKLVGFSNGEIARMLQITPAAVATNIYTEKKKTAKKPAAKRGAPSENPAA
jgi:DNA-directed RNA polymerase specialized sigma24 family protein